MPGVSHDIRIEALFKGMDTMENYIDFETPDLYKVMVTKTRSLLDNETAARQKISASCPKFMERCMENRSLVRKWFNENPASKFGALPMVEEEIP